MNFGDLFTSLATAAGIPADNEHFVKIMAMKDVITPDVPDEFSSSILSGLMTKDAALNNPDIINTLKAQSLNPVDEKIYTIAKEIFELDDAFISPIKETKGTYNRLDLFAKNLKEIYGKKLEEAKANPDNKIDNKKIVEEFEAKILALNNQVLGYKDHVTKDEHQEMIEGYEEKILGNMLSGLLGNYNYIFKDIAKEDQVNLATSAINTELQKRGVVLMNENGNLVLRQPIEGGEHTKYMVENKEFTPKDLADKTLSDRKLLMVNDPGTPPATPPGTPLALPPTNGDKTHAPGVREAYDKAMAGNQEIIDQSQIT